MIKKLSYILLISSLLVFVIYNLFPTKYIGTYSDDSIQITIEKTLNFGAFEYNLESTNNIKEMKFYIESLYGDTPKDFVDIQSDLNKNIDLYCIVKNNSDENIKIHFKRTKF